MKSNITSTPSSARGLYGMSEVAEHTGVGPQTLRLYERRGLLSPSRADDGSRRYRRADLTRLARISELVADRVELASVRKILTLEESVAALRAENARLARRCGGRTAATSPRDDGAAG